MSTVHRASRAVQSDGYQFVFKATVPVDRLDAPSTIKIKVKPTKDGRGVRTTLSYVGTTATASPFGDNGYVFGIRDTRNPRVKRSVIEGLSLYAAVAVADSFNQRKDRGHWRAYIRPMPTVA